MYKVLVTIWSILISIGTSYIMMGTQMKSYKIVSIGALFIYIADNIDLILIRIEKKKTQDLLYEDFDYEFDYKDDECRF